MIKRRRKATVRQISPGMREVAATVVTRRGELRLTQAQLAAKAGVSFRTMQSFEAGRSLPWPKNLSAIAGVLGLDAAELRRIGSGEQPVQVPS